MRVLIVLCLLLAATPAVAQQLAPPADAETLRRELEQMRQQFERVQGEYRKAMEAMSERLQRLEARPQAASAQPVLAQVPPGPAPTPLTPIDLLQPRQPFSLYERRGTGQLLFDMGVVSDFVGSLTQNNVERAQGGTLTGRENRFFPREVEVNFFGRIDPYAEGMLRFEFAEEFEGGVRATRANLAEAHLTLLTLPLGTRLTLGQVPVHFGLLSPLHREALPQPDPPQVLLRFLGEEQFRESGAELSWIAPTPFFLETIVGVFNGDNETAFGRGSLKSPLVTGRIRTFFDLTDTSAIQLGLSAADGRTAARQESTLAGFDVKYKYRPDGWLHPLLTVGSEGIYSFRHVRVQVDTDGDGVFEVARNRTRDRFGWYAYAELQPWRRWAFGTRYDNTQFPEANGREWAVEPYAAFIPSDFLRFRLGYKHTERDNRELFNLNGASATIVDEVLLQATFFLGAHPAHPF